MNRYPFEAIVAALGHPGVDEGAAALGISRRQWWRYFQTDLNEWQADRFAIAIGYHPDNLWPTFTADGDAMRICAADDCDNEFRPSNPRRQYCQRICAQRMSNRARRKAAA